MKSIGTIICLFVVTLVGYSFWRLNEMLDRIDGPWGTSFTIVLCMFTIMMTSGVILQMFHHWKMYIEISREWENEQEDEEDETPYLHRD